ncbi:MAG: hypothetical protein K1X56_00815 [Flavobacteriales bacterium]|nr:hypothetical protein [Flavobacteriales bacterium]
MKNSFPIFRKYSNNKSYFKIVSENHFVELKIMGNYFSVYEIKASILPERVFIQDMLEMQGEHWVSSDEHEFQQQWDRCHSELKLLP